MLATLLATMTTWTRTQALDTDRWVEVSGELLNEPQVQEALALYLTDELFSSIDIVLDFTSWFFEILVVALYAGAVFGLLIIGFSVLIGPSGVGGHRPLICRARFTT